MMIVRNKKWWWLEYLQSKERENKGKHKFKRESRKVNDVKNCIPSLEKQSLWAPDLRQCPIPLWTPFKIEYILQYMAKSNWESTEVGYLAYQWCNSTLGTEEDDIMYPSLRLPLKTM